MEQSGTGVGVTGTFRLKLGTTNVCSEGGQFMPGATAQGTGTLLVIQGTAAPGASVNTETAIVGGADKMNNLNGTAQPVAVATNGALTLQSSFQLSAATIGNLARLRQMLVEELN